MRSQPIRAAWIEISTWSIKPFKVFVAAHSGCVDLNNSASAYTSGTIVAAHSGCVDLNIRVYCGYCTSYKSQPSWAAWIEIDSLGLPRYAHMSQPSWAAWIEIICGTSESMVSGSRSPLGLRGLKYYCQRKATATIESQSTRAAWI